MRTPKGRKKCRCGPHNINSRKNSAGSPSLWKHLDGRVDFAGEEFRQSNLICDKCRQDIIAKNIIYGLVGNEVNAIQNDCGVPGDEDQVFCEGDLDQLLGEGDGEQVHGERVEEQGEIEGESSLENTDNSVRNI